MTSRSNDRHTSFPEVVVSCNFSTSVKVFYILSARAKHKIFRGLLYLKLISSVIIFRRIWHRTFVAMQSYQRPEAPRQTFHNTIFVQTLKASYFETSAHIITRRVCPTFDSIFLMFCFSRETSIPSMPSPQHSETRRNAKSTIHTTELAIPVVLFAVLHKKILDLY